MRTKNNNNALVLITLVNILYFSNLMADSTSLSIVSFKPCIASETWLTYSYGEEIENENYEKRIDLFFRRLRIGGGGNFTEWLDYNFQFYLDRLGEDNFASTKGSYGGFQLWDAYLTAKPLKNSDLLNIHFGYLWATISRENITSCWSVSSLDKTRASWYLKSFITGKGTGIENGISIGGLKNFEHSGISYRLGVYEPITFSNAKYSNKLYTGKIMISIGEPEQKKYKYLLPGNLWNKRKGITLGFGASSQNNGALNDSSYFNSSYSYGADFLINYVGFKMDGEYYKMERIASIGDNFYGEEWHLRTSYSFKLKNYFIEPVLAYEKYLGRGSTKIFKYVGLDEAFDAGINWYIKKDKLKVALHYVFQNTDFKTNKGDYVGLSLQARL